MSEESTPQQPWDMLDTETSKAFEVFSFYRDLGTDRSFAKVQEKYNYSTNRQVAAWSSKYNWMERVRAYDAYIDKKVREPQEDEIVKMRTQHANIARQMIVKGYKALEKKKPENISTKDLVSLLEKGVNIERLARGQSTQKIERNDSEATGEEQQLGYSDLSDEQLRTLLEIASNPSGPNQNTK